MDGYDATTYGERFAEVYDDWYGSITDTDACVAALADLAGQGRVLELGVGTGRLAVPLARRGVPVVGVDASPAMLQQLAAKPGADGVDARLGDMAAPPLADSETFDLVFVAYNTLFNLVDVAEQQRCLAAVAGALTPGGRFVVEAFVPDPEVTADAVTPRRVTADHVVLSVSRSQADRQEILGQYVDITETGIKLRPWHIRWSTVEQLDAMAADAGLVLADRWATWTGEPFGPDAATHISSYRLA